MSNDERKQHEHCYTKTTDFTEESCKQLLLVLLMFSAINSI